MKNRLVTRIFNDLETYQTWCRDFGKVFDEKDLYNKKSSTYSEYEFTRRTGRPALNQWEKDASILGCNI
jgi:hypothetical protein